MASSHDLPAPTFLLTCPSPTSPIPTPLTNHVCPVLHRRPRQGGRRHLHRVRRQGCVDGPPCSPPCISQLTDPCVRSPLPFPSGLEATGGASALFRCRASPGRSGRAAMLTPPACRSLLPARLLPSGVEGALAKEREARGAAKEGDSGEPTSPLLVGRGGGQDAVVPGARGRHRPPSSHVARPSSRPSRRQHAAADPRPISVSPSQPTPSTRRDLDPATRPPTRRCRDGDELACRPAARSLLYRCTRSLVQTPPPRPSSLQALSCPALPLTAREHHEPAVSVDDQLLAADLRAPSSRAAAHPHGRCDVVTHPAPGPLRPESRRSLTLGHRPSHTLPPSQHPSPAPKRMLSRSSTSRVASGSSQAEGGRGLFSKVKQGASAIRLNRFPLPSERPPPSSQEAETTRLTDCRGRS